MKKLLLTLAIIANLNAEMLIGECRYILHGLENEFWVIMGYAYFINGYGAEGADAFKRIWTYPEEVAKVDAYLLSLRRKGNGFANLEFENRYLIGRAKAKKAEIDEQKKICKKIEKKQ